MPPGAKEREKELTFEEIKKIIVEARQMGCQEWNISGGEPMLRPDFPEIFDFITGKARSYSLNTNGTLITPQIAHLLVRQGRKMVALYGATAAVHDHITRTAGSFAATMQGFAYLKEAGAGFIVQIIPMRDNHHQLAEMVQLAQSVSPYYKIGAAWLYLSACGSARRNAEIIHQRLDPSEVIERGQPDLLAEDWAGGESQPTCGATGADDRLYAGCIAGNRQFHIDPFGRMTFCYFIKDPAMRYDLRRGNFQEAWENFIPSLAERIRGGPEYQENCGQCLMRPDCRWCGVYGYLEHGRHSARVEYLCQVARESRAFKEDWKRHHCRYYQIAGITVRVEADLPITDQTFAPKFRQFEVDRPGPDLVAIRHHFILPALQGQDLGPKVYDRGVVVHRKNGAWIYLPTPPPDNPGLQRVAVFNHDHTRGRIYSNGEELFRQGGLLSLVLFGTDQILLAKLLADRQGCYLHSSAAILGGLGLLFVGHSEAGKSTTMKMLQGKAEILCDDRNIVRRWPEGFRVYGTWSHGEVPLVSSASAPLGAILFLQKATKNRLVPLKDRKEIASKLLACLIKPLATADWWKKMLVLVEVMAREIPYYEMQFDPSGEVVSLLEDLVQQPCIKAVGEAP
jgi:radical SAM protein with 4Fe4S-binding SPASM domain